LLLDFLVQIAVRGQIKAAGVDQQEFLAAPCGFAIITVTRHARPIVNNGLALADQFVEQRRFAGIGPSDDGEHRQTVRLGKFFWGGIHGVTCPSRVKRSGLGSSLHQRGQKLEENLAGQNRFKPWRACWPMP
jgi:hypothetical protein